MTDLTNFSSEKHRPQKIRKRKKMSSSTSVSALLLHGRLLSPSRPSKPQPFLAPPNNPFRPPASASARPSPARPPLLAAGGAAAASGRERDNRVQELRVPDSWLTPEVAAQVRSKSASLFFSDFLQRFLQHTALQQPRALVAGCDSPRICSPVFMESCIRSMDRKNHKPCAQIVPEI
jgi:hypothetical protein